MGEEFTNERIISYGYCRPRLNGAAWEATPYVYTDLVDGERIYMVDGESVDFDAFAAWYLHFSEKRELLGNTSHLLYICRKQA